MTQPLRQRDQHSLGFELQAFPGASSKGVSGVKESVIQKAVLQALRLHPKVAWCERMNTGAGYLGQDNKTTGAFKKGRFIRFAFKGCSDILGQLTDGRFMACEVKAAGGQLRDDQAHFLSRVNQFGGVGFIARSIDDVVRHLADDPFVQEN